MGREVNFAEDGRSIMVLGLSSAERDHRMAKEGREQTQL